MTPADILEAYQAYTGLRRHVTEQTGTTMPVAAMLAALEAQPLSMGELSRVLGAAGSTLTDMMDRGERQGAVERIRDREDRRKILVSLAPVGRRTLDGLRHPLPAAAASG